MPKYRLLHMNCRTGRRSRELTRLEYTVWIAYMLSADDFGVCPASSRRLQADDPFLAMDKPKAVDQAIETLIRVGLVGVFEDGKDRYLYQPDWQDYQKIKHPSKTSLPAIPAELLEKCSPETAELFREFHPKRLALLPLHAGACDANANANANANPEGSLRGTNEPPRHAAPVSAAPLLMSPIQYQRLQERNAFVGSRLQVPKVLHAELRTGLGGTNPEAKLQAWYGELNAEAEQTGEPITDPWQWVRPKFRVWAQGEVDEQGRSRLLAALKKIEASNGR